MIRHSGIGRARRHAVMLLRALLHLLAAALLLPGMFLAAFSGAELTMLLTGQVQPGELLFLGDVAQTHLQSALTFAMSLGVIGVGSALSRLARAKALTASGMPPRGAPPATPAPSRE